MATRASPLTPPPLSFRPLSSRQNPIKSARLVDGKSSFERVHRPCGYHQLSPLHSESETAHMMRTYAHLRPRQLSFMLKDDGPARHFKKPQRNVNFTPDVLFKDHIRENNLEQVGRFIRASKVKLDALNPSGLAAMHEAAIAGHVDCVQLLLYYDAELDPRSDRGWTPLHFACANSNAEVVRYLLEQGASPDASTNSGELPDDLVEEDGDPQIREDVVKARWTRPLRRIRHQQAVEIL
uniref:protein phosphatase 1 regulatory subunit 27-like n=1 Tax=Myxine glutinosa TaxID=7769 RepID=UPI00358E421D